MFEWAASLGDSGHAAQFNVTLVPFGSQVIPVRCISSLAEPPSMHLFDISQGTDVMNAPIPAVSGPFLMKY